MPTLLTLFINALPAPARRRLVRADPGMLRTARAARAMLAFLLTLIVCLLIGKAADVPVLSFLIAFPVTAFCCAAIGDDEVRARIGKIAALAASAGVMFTLSALLHGSLVNHAVFILVIGAAAYLRQYGGPWIPVGLAANVSYFFGAFLKPDPTQLHWQWVGVAIGAICAVVIHQLVVPHRPWRRMRWAVAGIRMRLADLLRTAAGFRPNDDLRRLRDALAAVAEAITIAEGELENLAGGRLAHRPLAEALIATLVLAERLALQVEGAPAVIRSDAFHAAANRLATALSQDDSLPHDEPLTPLAQAVEELERTIRLDPDLDAARSVDPPPPAPVNAVLRPAVQSAAAAALAIAGGAALSPQRWYWAVITVFVMFTGTYSRGQALFKSLQRTFGTLAGILVAMVLIWALHGNALVALVLMPVAIFCIFYAFVQAYTWMAFWITVLVGLLFSALGHFTDSLMLLRLEETAIGAASGIVVAALVLPHRTDDHAREQFRALADAVDATLDAALPGGPLDRLRLTAALHEFEAKLAALREAIEPLRLFPLPQAAQQRGRLTRQLVLASYWMHEIALAVRLLDSRGVGQTPPIARDAADALHARLAPLRIPGNRAQDPGASANPRPLPPETSDPIRAIRTATRSLGDALTASAWLLTDRHQQTRAFRF